MSKVICFGEILWDVFPDKKIIGGAPLNVALRLHSLGVPVSVMSCLGADVNGKAALDYLEKNELTSAWIQEHPTLRTGEVLVKLDQGGSASYTISEPVAWDAISLVETMVEVVRNTPFFLFGSLAQRGEINQHTLKHLLQAAQTTIFDVNLRKPHYSIPSIYELMKRAHVLKLNDEELEEICAALKCPETKMEPQIHWLEKVTGAQTICITKGAKGALLKHQGQLVSHPGFRVRVVDTVGAGDSFLATLIASLLIKKESPKKAIAKACAVGALVASRAGGNCTITKDEIAKMIDESPRA